MRSVPTRSTRPAASRQGALRRSALLAGLLLAAVLPLAALVAACGEDEPAASPSPTPTLSAEQLMRERILLLQGYIETYALEHYYSYPKAAGVREGGVLPAPLWPADPWTGEAMRPGASPGTYTYEVEPDRRRYRLVGHLPKGEIEVKGAMPSSGRTAYQHREQEGLTLIRQFVIQWALRNGGLYPPASEVSREGGVGALRVGFWPSNPWNHGPMEQSDRVGDFSYEVAADRTSCRLVLHIADDEDWVLECGADDLALSAPY
jgi:hypothetical protein